MQQEVKKIPIAEAITEWNKLKIVRCDMTFDCGGDSMNDYNFEFFDEGENTIDSILLENYFEQEIWNEVTFYEASDGHYIGENGVVTITLNEEGEGFDYSKSAQSEWNEQFSGELLVKLTDEQAEFINKYVLNIMGGEDSGSKAIINYKGDFILTDNDERIEGELADLIYDEAIDLEIDEAEGEPSDWFNFNTNEDNEELVIEDSMLKVKVTRTYYVYKDSED
jgi:hypothetical protein